MTIGPQEVVRSEVEGGLSGPANPIPRQSIDCGCGQMPCPKLARFATRWFFISLLCWIGLVQAAGQAYLFVTGSTVARRFQFDPYLMDWVLLVSEITPIFFGLAVAYWGDRIHRAAWSGALVLLQSVGYVVLLIPHFTQQIKFIEETENVTHMSLYADDSPELCETGISRIIMEDSEPSCLIILSIFIIVQVLAGIGSIAYYSLGISYLDDNTKKKIAPAFIGLILAVKAIGYLLGYLIAWGSLRIDADNFNIIESYEDQIGAWWLGWPILAFLLAIPGGILALFPRRLPSEVVEQAAASILDLNDRTSRSTLRSTTTKVGSISFFPSLLRLITNKIIICNVMAAAFWVTAIVNFQANENSILESRFFIPRPTGLFLGFGDPWHSRLTVTILKPVVIGLVVIIAGLVITRMKPQAKWLASYNVVIVILAATIVLALAFATCDKPPIVGERRGAIDLLRYCNKNCGCSRDSDFRPICDSNGMFTFYSACYAGCAVSSYIDGEKMYGECRCVEEMTGLGNDQAKDGPCGSTSCSMGWIVFQVGTILVCALLASSIVGSLLINLRATYIQDKALMIGFLIACVAFFVYIPGKLIYDKIADMTCQHWGVGRSICHLHDTRRFGDYTCYLTALLLAIGGIFKGLVWLFAGNLKIYGQQQEEEGSVEPTTELRNLTQTQLQPLLSQEPEPSTEIVTNGTTDKPSVPTTTEVQSRTIEEAEEMAQPVADTPLKYGPLGPGDRRTDLVQTASQDAPVVGSTRVDSDEDVESTTDDDSHTGEKDTSPKIAYRPLDLDSDVESDLSSTGPRSRRRVRSREFEPGMNVIGVASFPENERTFPNPDDYVNPRKLTDSPEDYKASRAPRIVSLMGSDSVSPTNDDSMESELRDHDGFSKTDSFEYAKKKKHVNGVLKNREPYRLAGDFNEVGIPVIEPASDMNVVGIPILESADEVASTSVAPRLRSEEPFVEARPEVGSGDSATECDVPPQARRPHSRGQESSGFGSLPDIQERTTPVPVSTKVISKSRESLSSPTSTTSSNQNRPPPLNTDL